MLLLKMIKQIKLNIEFAITIPIQTFESQFVEMLADVISNIPNSPILIRTTHPFTLNLAIYLLDHTIDLVHLFYGFWGFECR